MELKIDLLKGRGKSRLRIVFGVLCILLSGAWLIVGILEKESELLFLWILQGLLFTLMGIVHLMEGLGYSLGSYFGRAFVLINSEVISLKTNIYGKGQCVNWSEINSMNYQLNKFNIQKTDNTTVSISLVELDYLSVQEVKKTIYSIAEEKNIQIT
ncbi:MAG: hypothetical protein LBE91_04570 [Tannerella sp.]|jgi:hypothetical protein|nr:hypothetical protein [Tannerella sp.]